MDREYVHTYWDPGTFDNRFIVEHMRDKYVKACQEIGIPSKPINTDYYILPKYIYENVPSCEKDIDYLFVGNMVFIGMYPHKGVKNRRWVIEFAKNNFNAKSYFCNISCKMRHMSMKQLGYVWQKLGVYDMSYEDSDLYLNVKKIKPKLRCSYDAEYYTRMSRSKFCLCPAGDLFWSSRFVEAIMCKCIPVISRHEESYRSFAESKLDYRYYLRDEKHVYRQDWVEHNYNIFAKYHTLTK